MKIFKNIHFLLSCSVALVLTGCSDFLEVDVKGKATIPSFLSDPQGLHAAMVGTYNKMYLYVDNEFTKYGDVAGNMVTFPSAASSGDMIAQYNFMMLKAMKISGNTTIVAEIQNEQPGGQTVEEERQIVLHTRRKRHKWYKALAGYGTSD